jgi:hypothetical protein
MTDRGSSALEVFPPGGPQASPLPTPKVQYGSEQVDSVTEASLVATDDGASYIFAYSMLLLFLDLVPSGVELPTTQPLTISPRFFERQLSIGSYKTPSGILLNRFYLD